MARVARRRTSKALSSSAIKAGILKAPIITEEEVSARAEELATEWDEDCYVYVLDDQGNVVYSQGRDMWRPYLKPTFVMEPPPPVGRVTRSRRD